MRQVTGSNSTLQNEKVSIRLVSGGHSFSVEEISADIPNDAAVRIIADTHRVTLVPAEIFDADQAIEYLAINGLAPTAEESVVWSEPSCDKIAVIAISSRAKCDIESRFAEHIEWHTPLLDTLHSDQACCCLTFSGDNCYIRLYNAEGLRVAEALHISDFEDALYYITQIMNIEAMPTTTPIYIKGDGGISKLLKRYFKRVICE